jgi:hypothetical protein
MAGAGAAPGSGVAKRVIQRLLVVVISLAATVLVLEAAFRIISPSEHIPQREYDAYLGWRGRPNLDCKLTERHFSISISQNEQGFRDRNRAWEKQEGLARVLFVGDSYTWGWAVEQDAIFTHVLEQRFLRQGWPVEVINTGVGGYSTDQILLYLLREGFWYSPDVVVYQVAANDIPGNTLGVSEGVYSKPFFRLEETGDLTLQACPVAPFTPEQRLTYWVSRHSRLAYFIKHRLHVSLLFRRGKEAPREESVQPAADAPGDYAFELFCALTHKIDQECRQRGVRFVALFDFDLGPQRWEYWQGRCGDVETYFVRDYLLSRKKESGTPATWPRREKTVAVSPQVSWVWPGLSSDRFGVAYS